MNMLLTCFKQREDARVSPPYRTLFKPTFFQIIGLDCIYSFSRSELNSEVARYIFSPHPCSSIRFVFNIITPLLDCG